MPDDHVVLYRKWRPKKFRSVIGQDAIVRTLRNAVRDGRVAHAYLFSGPRGTGKTTMGRLLAKASSCEAPNDGDGCNKCASCATFLTGRALDLIEIDAASNRGIDEVRKLRSRAAFVPVFRRKVYLIDEAHMLTEPACNALLKILEEPPKHVIFILATTEPEKLLATIVSRCQRFDFHRIDLEDITHRVAYVADREGIVLSDGGAEIIARAARGSVRDALSLLDATLDAVGTAPTIAQIKEAVGMTDDPRATAFARMLLDGNLGDGLLLIVAVQDSGVNMRRFQQQVTKALRAYLYRKRRTEAVLRALRLLDASYIDGDGLTALPLEIALAEMSLAAGVGQSSVAVDVARSAPTLVPKERIERSVRRIQAFITEHGHEEAFLRAREIGLDYGVSWTPVDETTDRLELTLTDAGLVAYAAALGANRRREA